MTCVTNSTNSATPNTRSAVEPSWRTSPFTEVVIRIPSNGSNSVAMAGPSGQKVSYPFDLVHCPSESWRSRAEDASSVILGYTVANDVTARDLQRSDGQWTRSKGYDTFCPLGPAIATEFDPLEGMRITTSVNGDVRQEGSTADLVFGVAELVEFVTRVMTLLPGDVILTGTPSGVGPLESGDRVDVEVEGIGVLSNPVV